MTGYNCPTCHLAVEIGYTLSWDLSGGSQQIACRSCGTIHQIRHPNNAPDVLLAQPSPLHYDLLAERPATFLRDWTAIRELPTSIESQRERVLPKRMEMVNYKELTCYHCGEAGTLTPLSESWPRETDKCPNCGRAGIAAVYADT